jgi:hypothetical protein
MTFKLYHRNKFAVTESSLCKSVTVRDIFIIFGSSSRLSRKESYRRETCITSLTAMSTYGIVVRTFIASHKMNWDGFCLGHHIMSYGRDPDEA